MNPDGYRVAYFNGKNVYRSGLRSKGQVTLIVECAVAAETQRYRLSVYGPYTWLGTAIYTYDSITMPSVGASKSHAC